MRFLPVVERELRVAARSKATHRSRFIAALIGAFVLVAMTLTMQRSVIPSRIGAEVFGMIVFLLTWFCLIGGVMTTFDRLSEERRQGTLGLLFLTPLRNFDIILGKFAGATLQVFFGAVAATPILVITLSFGGVTFGEIGRVALALLTILFFGAAAGLLVSSFMEDASKALLAAVVFVVGWLLLIELAAAAQRGLYAVEIFPVSALSPVRLPFLAEDSNQAADPWRFHRPFACVQAVSWLFLLIATRVTARTRQEAARKRPKAAPFRRPTAPDSATPRRRRQASADAGLLEQNAATWLAVSNSPHRRLLPFLTLGSAVVILGILAAGWFITEELWFAPALIAGLFINLLLKLWIGVAACQMFNDERRNGALELLLSTPVPPAMIVSGHQEALLKIFEPTVWKVLAIQCIPIVAGCVVAGFHGDIFWTVMIPICAFISLMTDLRAMGWLGLWNGLVYPKMHTALGRTVFKVLVIPWLVAIVPCLGWVLFLCTPIYAAIVANSAEEKFFNHFPRIVTEPGAFKNGKPVPLKRPPMPVRRPAPPPLEV